MAASVRRPRAASCCRWQRAVHSSATSLGAMAAEAAAATCCEEGGRNECGKHAATDM
jgi:hypothetical protein